MDLRSRLTMPIAELARLIQARSYPSLHRQIAGKLGVSTKRAQQIEAACNGEIKATWLLGLETPPVDPHPSPSTETKVVDA